jgi:aminopeptidase N
MIAPKTPAPSSKNQYRHLVASTNRDMRTKFLLAVIPLVFGCAAPATTPPAPSPAPVTDQTVSRIPSSGIPRPTPLPIQPVVWRPDSSALAVADFVPPFRTAPLITWGPLPPGTQHAERVRSYDLIHQVVRVSFDWTRHATVGSTTITLAGLPGAPPLSSIAIDAEGMRIKSVTDGGTAAGPGAKTLTYDYDGHSLSVRLASPLRAGQRTTFSVDYESSTPRKGAYFNERKHVVWTQGETEDTRYWVPTYDYPNDKETWEFFIRSAKNEHALSNGRLAGSRPIGADSIEWHWILEKPASTYLMTTVVGNYAVVSDRPSANGATIAYWTYPDSIEAAKRGFAGTPDAVDLFSRKTGVPYPWPKYDQVVIPDFQFGGMENVTATSQNDAEIIYPASALPQAYSGGLMSHELGHQWYGDLLTTRRWDDAWLNEGFATFMEETHAEATLGADEGALDRLSARNQVVDADRRARRPLVYGRWQRGPFELFFSGHIYPKGAAVLQMLRHQLGDDLFWKSMQRYTLDNAYGTVVSDDLRKAFEKTAGRSFKAFFDQWVYGSGMPAFQVSAAYDRTAGTLTIAAREVQPRDSLTGFFDVDADVEIRTDAGIVNGVVPVRNGTGSKTFAVTSVPLSIRWDKGGWILGLANFPRSTNMLGYQLKHDDDVIGRIEAADLLGERVDDEIAIAALIAASHDDPFWAVRAGAIASLGDWNHRPGNRESLPEYSAVHLALLDASRDADARVRQNAADALTSYPGAATIGRLRDLASNDANPFVRGHALAADVRVEGEVALPLVREILPQDIWRNVIRTPVLHALQSLGSPEALALVKKFTPVVLPIF